MQSPVSVTELSVEKFKEFLDSFDHVFSDCDGVIWSVQPYPGSGKFFKLMKKLGKTVNYVSNNSIRTKENYEAKFQSAGIQDGFENLTIPSTAIAEYLKSKNLKKKVYCIACAETVHVLESNGFKCETGPELVPEYYAEFVQFLVGDEEIGAVVFDSDFRINLPKLYKATTYLRRPEVLFVNGATDRVVPLKPGVTALGVGIFSDLVAETSKREPVALGKPGKQFGEFAMKRAGVKNPDRVLFIGDMIEQDIGLGRATGFKTLLVLTNNSKETMMAHEKIRPDFYAPDLGSIVPLLEKVLQSKV
ncbi:haloacid dehalogenase-like hydrolase domain-containing protein [Phthorimaea operculella]|nr:haloacid dehalogenase-like hydrolase domain-containing protein [Phthorimaea operculella]